MPDHDPTRPVPSEESVPVSGARLRELVVDANDGIMATAGIVEGFIGAGASRTSLLIAAFSSMLAGGIAVGATKYGEAAAERDAHLALIDEERRQLDLSPEEELDELAAFYEAKGLTPDLARQVAIALSEGDPLAAHIEAEHGIVIGDRPARPVLSAMTSGFVFAIGSTISLLVIVLVVRRWLVFGTFLAVTVALCLTSWVTSRWGQVPLGKTLARNVTIGLSAMLITYLVGSLFAA